jgi:tRNA/tmRNA/rRNA uracil-C5-methylase (TrmA/RlmC/RlmD family)
MVRHPGHHPGKGAPRREGRAPAPAPIPLRVERLAWGGKGVARAEDGRLILLTAPLALFPGEEVEAQVRWKPRHGEGDVTAWTRRDPRRVPADCPVAQICGGCDLWEAGPEAPALKRAMVEDLIARQLPGAPVWRWLEAPPEACRHRIQLHWDGRSLGYHRRRSNVVVPVKACPAATPCLSAAIPRLEEALAARVLPSRPQRWELASGTPPGTVMVQDEGGRSWVLEPDGWHASTEGVFHRLGEARLGHRAGGFFQVCPPWAWRAFGEILGAWDLPGGTLYDLYGGVGFFTALLGDRFERSVLVEFDAPAVAWARRNLEGRAATCVEADAAAWVAEGLGEAGDLLLLDPPRTGLAEEIVPKLQAAGARDLVLVGCDGAAFCRDARRLAPAWRLTDLAVADLFPLTSHVECVGRFTRE